MRDRSGSSHRRKRSNRRGVSLIEVMIALSILSVVLVSLSGLMFQMGRHTRRSGGSASRTAAVQSALALAQAVPWDSLSTIVGCGADSAGTLAYTRCFSLQSVSTRLTEVQIVIVPTDPLLLADTLTVRRNRPRSISPLYSP